jgi:polyamine-modulated factor 1
MWGRKTNTNKLFEEYDVQKNVDILHKVVTEARARRQRGEAGSSADTWRADLQPRAAVRAQTITTLERERDSLRARLAEVRFLGSCPTFPHSSPALIPF